MDNKMKINLIKISSVSTLIAFAVIFPGCCIYGWFLPEEATITICAICGIITLVSGVSVIIFVFAFHIEPEPVKPDKAPLPYQDFEVLDEHLRQVLGESRYQSHPGDCPG